MNEKAFDYLNVIPLVDVMLVLLTIVLTTSTFIATGGIEVELPQASTSLGPSASHPRTLSIDREGRMWLEKSEIGLDALADRLAGMERTTPIVVRADKGLALQVFVDVYETLQRQGFTNLSLQTEQRP